MKKSPRNGSHPRVRSKIKQQFVFETLRDQILSGKYAAGAKLPVQTELAAAFQASTPTIQQAVRRLAREGFVVARPRIGTVVAPKLRHLHNLALVLPNDPVLDTHYSRFLRFWPTRRATCKASRIGRLVCFTMSIPTATRKTDSG